MSAYDLQRATALLIRRPDDYRGAKLPEFLKQFQLTDHEQYQVKKMSEDPAVEKYGRLMGSSRERKVTALLRQSQHYLYDDLMTRIWKDYFEPKAISIKYNNLPLAFLKLLLEDKEANDLLKAEAPPFIPDMLRFELGLAHFRMKHYSDLKAVPQGSLLKHSDIVLLELDYDIQGLRAKILKDKDQAGKLAPDQRKVKLLFIRKDTSWDARVFEIDDETYQFLKMQLTTPAEAVLPKSYDSLVSLGVCLERT